MDEAGKTNVPQPVIDAALNGKLIVFVGAGLSAMKGMPTWKQLAEKALDKLAEKRRISYAEAELLKGSPPRTILSFVEIICGNDEKNFLADLIKDDEDKCCEKKDDQASENYENIWRISQCLVTTNYDNFLEIHHSSRRTSAKESTGDKPEELSCTPFYTEEDFSKWKDGLEKGNVVFHLHGSTKNPQTMVFSTGHYLKLYGEKADNRKSFLKELFKDRRYVFLFIGYSLGELEVLEYMITKSAEENPRDEGEPTAINKYIIQGFFEYEERAVQKRMEEYWHGLGIQLIPFKKDERNHAELYNVIDRIARHVRPLDKRLEFSEELRKLGEENNG